MTQLLRRFVISFSPWWALLSFALMGMSLVITWSSNCDGYNAVLLSTPYRITSILTYVQETRYLGERRQPLISFDGVSSRQFPHIVLIVDESVLGCELSINGYPRLTVPFLDEHQKMYWNGGIASSGVNNTYESHRILLSGLRQDQLPDLEQLSEKNASIFQYAIGAGYPSMCLSAQKIRNTLTGGYPFTPQVCFRMSKKSIRLTILI
jgi:glucan phosphoethanolaminetransferase (alkaline phosphatase superfamily)